MESQTRASMGMGSAKKGMIEGKALAICFSLIHGLAFISYIYIYGTPPKTYADFNFTGIYSEFYIFWHRFCSD